MEKYIQIKNKKLGTTNEPKVPYLDFEGNYCNLKVSTIEDYDIYFDKVYYKENNIIIVPKRDFIYQTNASTGEVLSGLYNYSWRKFGDKNSGFNYKDYPECIAGTFVKNQGSHIIRGMYKMPQQYLDELTNIKPIGSAYAAFAYLDCLTTLNGVEKTWDTSKITNMGHMFNLTGTYSPDASTDTYEEDYCRWSKYQQETIDLSNWDFSSATSVSNMFYCTRFEVISDKPVDLKNITSTYNMFYSYYRKSIPKLITNNVTTMQSMFYSSHIANIPQLNTSKVTNMNNMFYRCINLPSVFPWVIDCSSITQAENMSNMFNKSFVTEVYLYNVREDIKQNITSYLLKSDYSLTIHFVDSLDINIDSSLKISNNNYKISDTLGKGRTYLHDGIDIQGLELTTCNLMFSDCSGLMEIPEFDTDNVTDMAGMFKNCKNIRYIPHFNTSKVTDMTEMFYTCASLIDIPLLDTSNVTNMSSMFRSCVHLKTIPLLDTSKVTNMNNMFHYCYELTTIPELNTSKVTSMAEMFHYCRLLSSISQIDTSNVTTMVSMFRECRYLSVIPELDTSKSTDMRQMFFDCVSLPSEFPWPIDCNSITKIDYLKSIFEESSVTKVQLKNVKEELKSSITSKLLKNNDTLTIEFID